MVGKLLRDHAKELIHRMHYGAKEAARAAVFEYFDCFSM